MEVIKLICILIALGGAGYVLKSGEIDLPHTLGFGTFGDAPGAPVDTANLLRRDLPGQNLRSPGIALPYKQYALATDVFQSLVPATETDLPGEIATLGPLSDCTFRRPTKEERVANISVGRSTALSAVEAFSNEDLAKAAMNVLTLQKQDTGRAVDPDDHLPSSRMNVVDVVLTETSAPIYLILQSSGDGVIWNMQVAPGVTIAHVAMIAAQDAGIAHLDPSVPLQAATAESCGISVAREPGDDWDFVRNTKDGRGDEDLLKTHIARHAAYSAWFEGQFGQPSEEGLIGFLEADHVLVGPVPHEPERLVQASLAGASLRITPQDHVIAGTPKERRAAISGLMIDLLDRAVGAEFATLRDPKPATRTE